MAAATATVGIGIATAASASAVPGDPYVPPNPIRAHESTLSRLAEGSLPAVQRVTTAFSHLPEKFSTGISVAPG